MGEIGSKGPPNGLFLDDLAVGRRFSSRSHTVSADEIKAFAAQFDPQPFHLSDEAAKGTLFGGLAASVLIFAIIWSQVEGRVRAEQIETALASEKERLTVTLNSIGDGVITDRVGAAGQSRYHGQCEEPRQRSRHE